LKNKSKKGFAQRNRFASEPVQWNNILDLPLAVTASGIIIAVAKRKKTSAK